MPQEFLGVGWNYPVTNDPNNRIALAKFEESIRQSIWIILGTSPGERVMRPTFGCGLNELIFSSATAETLTRANNLIRESLLRWEPRIDVLEVTVNTDRKHPNHLMIVIEYQVRLTNSRFNLVYPFNLEQ
ncbi:MAG: baseplate protein [Anaerolineaceae bacterium]|nr:baseplate protein [Anaerolineaceae bacterium]